MKNRLIRGNFGEKREKPEKPVKPEKPTRKTRPRAGFWVIRSPCGIEPTLLRADLRLQREKSRVLTFTPKFYSLSQLAISYMIRE